jgi:bifunctional non-homologous end joining protein LigD
LPKWIGLQLALLVKSAPDGPEWLHEIKYDGYRPHARLEGEPGFRCIARSTIGLP